MFRWFSCFNLKKSNNKGVLKHSLKLSLRNRSKRLTKHVDNVAVYFFYLSKQIPILSSQFQSSPNIL